MKWKSWKVMPDEIRRETNYILEDLDDESLTYVNHFQAFDDSHVALQEGCPKELEGREDNWAWLCGHFQEADYVVFFLYYVENYYTFLTNVYLIFLYFISISTNTFIFCIIEKGESK
ncbi:unnamed protein product [Prunus brigantina]